MICQCPAIVLRATDFQESSRIVSLFARDFGKVSVIAKGARSPKSKFSGKLEPGLIVDAVYHHKTGRSVHTLTELSVANPWPPGANHPDRYVARIAFTDLLNRLLQEDGANEALFDNSAQVLNWLADTPYNPVQLFPYIIVRICDWLGVAMQCDNQPNAAVISPHFELETGTLSNTFGAKGMPVTNPMFAYMFHAIAGNRKDLLELELPEADLRQMTYMMDRYIAYHFDGVRPRTAQILFDSYSEALS
jgi:DNA repair protein RecO (recombination protein O)